MNLNKIEIWCDKIRNWAWHNIGITYVFAGILLIIGSFFVIYSKPLVIFSKEIAGALIFGFLLIVIGYLIYSGKIKPPSSYFE